MKIAIVYDWLDKWGGVERMLQMIAQVYPDADFFTSIYDAEEAKWAMKLSVKTSFIQSLPDFIKKNRILSSQLYPFAFESFDFSGYDLVISVTSSFAKGIITKPDTKHVSIILTPTRYIWDLKDEYKKSTVFNLFAAPQISKLRKWDFISAQRPDELYGISQLVVDRSEKVYKRKTELLYPAFDEEYWKNTTPKAVETPSEYYLVISRLEPYKKIDLVIQTMNAQQKHCIIVGKGSEMESLKARAGKTIHFMSDLSDEEVTFLYKHATALIMPQEEDFGYTALEALFFHCPVISYRYSGAAEIIEENKTGCFFDNQNTSSLAEALERFASVPYNVSSYAERILKRFAKKDFVDKIKSFTK